jgi:hypothetical protein
MSALADLLVEPPADRRRPRSAIRSASQRTAANLCQACQDEGGGEAYEDEGAGGRCPFQCSLRCPQLTSLFPLSLHQTIAISRGAASDATDSWTLGGQGLAEFVACTQQIHSPIPMKNKPIPVATHITNPLPRPLAPAQTSACPCALYKVVLQLSPQQSLPKTGIYTPTPSLCIAYPSLKQSPRCPAAPLATLTLHAPPSLVLLPAASSPKQGYIKANKVYQ